MWFMMMLSLVCLVVILQVEGVVEPTCSVGESCANEKDKSRKYYWPTAFGHPSHYGVAPWPQPTNLSTSFSWRWHHPDGVFHELPIAVVIDDQKNVYASAERYSYKLSPNGEVIWKYQQIAGTPDGPSIMDGTFFGDTTSGHVFAVDMETGKEKWVKKVDTTICGDTGFLSAYHGVVIVSTGTKECHAGPGCKTVRALNASNGNQLWEFDTDNAMWDFMAQFTQDDTVIFQDSSGVIYRLELERGKLLWKNGGVPGSWTDGTQFLGSNGIVYQTNNDLEMTGSGNLGAYRVSDGTFLWKQEVPKSPNTSPVVGRLGKSDRLSVVMPIGHQTGFGAFPPTVLFLWSWFSWLGVTTAWIILKPIHLFSIWLGDYQRFLWRTVPRQHDIYVFDAETGSLQWKWEGPINYQVNANGDEAAFQDRVNLKMRTACWPTPWSAARIGSDGTIYVGDESGIFFAIRDVNGDNRIDDDEVSAFNTQTNFPSCGSAHAPGMVVVANCDSIWAWKS